MERGAVAARLRPLVLSREKSALTVTYSPVEDMLLGDMSIGEGPDIRVPYPVSAKKEIDAKLAPLYVLPLDLDAIEPWAVDYLSDTSNKIASGRFIMSQAVGGEDGQVNPYGRFLLREGQNQLAALASYEVILEGAEKKPSGDKSRAPGVINRDGESATEAFENAFMRGEPWWWQPGAATPDRAPEISLNGLAHRYGDSR